MSIIDIWKTNVKAQEVLTKQYSEPFRIKLLNKDSSSLARFEIEQINPFYEIFPRLESVFLGIQKKDVHLDQGYFLHNANSEVRNTKDLEEFAEGNYFDFSPKPCFSGEVVLNRPPFEWVEELTGKYPDESGETLATLNEIDTIDEYLIKHPRFNRDELIGAVFRATPSQTYISSQHVKFCQFLKDHLGLEVFTSEQDSSKVLCKNVFIKPRLKDYLSNKIVTFSSYHKIIFEIAEEPFNEFLQTRIKRNIYFTSEDGPEITFGVILPTPEANKFIIEINKELSLSEIQFEIFHFQKVFERYFKKEQIGIAYYQGFKLSNWVNQEVFYEELKQSTSDSKFNVSAETKTVAFDFQNKEELQDGIEKLRNIKIADIDYHLDDHKFKVNIKHKSPLIDVQRDLASIPSVTSEITNDQKRLFFYCTFPNQELRHILQNRVEDKLQNASLPDASYHFHELKDGFLKYHLSFKESDYLKDLQKKFEYLNGEAISIMKDNRKEVIGTITSVNLPYLDILPEDFIDHSLFEDDWITASCELRGERDKIKRLTDTVDVIFSDQKQNIPNRKLPDILKDSSVAPTFDGDITRSQDYINLKYNIAENLLSTNINEKQLEGICKSLLAEDLFMIQGPPGTGKSTAISELIWQHIRESRENNQEEIRVLVTSETNLAVDNALEKLKSNNHMLNKPIRFGSEDKLDKEGRQFSLENLTNWVNRDLLADDINVSQGNILDCWIMQVKARSEKSETSENQDTLRRWQNFLCDKTPFVRSIFYKSYISNSNVVGATCSSIGKLNSVGTFTSFFRNYCQVVYPTEYDNFQKNPSRTTAAKLKSKKIDFDIVVQDEASKASPPELALPCLYGKKSIVIGDHRQLPPVVDTNEFLENLKELRKKNTQTQDKQELSSLIRYITDNREAFKKSHFETLFDGIHENLRTSFDTQYRMHPGINETVRQFYSEDGGLNCGISEEDANSPDLSNPMSRYHGVTKTDRTHVVWIDVKSPEIKKGTSRYNPGEVEKIDWLLDKIKKQPGYEDFINFWPSEALDEKQIGIITFYGAQTGELKKLQDRYPDMPMRISPVDRFQGMERNIIIVSLVRSNRIAQFPNQPPNYEDFPELGYAKQDSLGFAEFPNRLNVALSRAKRLLVIVGNSEHFRTNSKYDQVYKTIEASPYGRIMKDNGTE